MATAKLPESATVATVVSTLDKPEDYVRGVFGNMLDTKKEHGSAHVRIGITGRGIVPHYRVEPALDRILDEVEAFFVAFNGRNHKRLDWGAAELRGSHWSEASMSYDDVQSLLGQLRGFKRKMV